MNAHDTVERIATDCYARLLAISASRTNDLSAAEDALSDAFHAALQKWPVVGVPKRPEAWLITAAKRRLMDYWRHSEVHAKHDEDLRIEAERSALSAVDDFGEGQTFPDERLKLLFACTHPAIESGMRAPLMLQTVLGMDAKKIASAFLVSPSTMSQRLVRVKNKIRDARIPFKIPELFEMRERVESVLEAIYAAYSTSWESQFDLTETSRGLNDEAIYLAQVLVTLVANEPEAAGLLALLLYCEARQPSRRDANRNYVPLNQQDVKRWDKAMIGQAENILRLASKLDRPGRFQLEAAIQSAHVDRVLRKNQNWPDILLLYRNLLDVAPSLGSQVAYAAALHQAGQNQAASEHLARLPEERVEAYQPYWATKAHVFSALGIKCGAEDALRRAAGLSQDEATRRFLLSKLPG